MSKTCNKWFILVYLVRSVTFLTASPRAFAWIVSLLAVPTQTLAETIFFGDDYLVFIVFVVVPELKKAIYYEVSAHSIEKVSPLTNATIAL